MALLLKTVFYAITVAILVIEVIAKPGNFYEFGGSEPHEDRCSTDLDERVIETCQRCAKQTKSPIVYPMCCVNEDDVYNWCIRYITYGKQAK